MPLNNPRNVEAQIATHTALPFAHQTARRVATGMYSGNDGSNRQISTGFKCSLVIIHCPTSATRRIIIPDLTIKDDSSAHNLATVDAVLHATDGFEVDHPSSNQTGRDYYWWAITE